MHSTTLSDRCASREERFHSSYGGIHFEVPLRCNLLLSPEPCSHSTGLAPSPVALESTVYFKNTWVI